MIPHPYAAESMGLEPGDRIAYRGRVAIVLRLETGSVVPLPVPVKNRAESFT